MRSILAIVAGLFLCASVSALNIPSSVSGVYDGPDRSCSIVFSRMDAQQKLVNIECLAWSPGNLFSNSITVHANDGQCPTDSATFQFRSVYTGLGYNAPGFRIIGIGSSYITVRVGSLAEIGMNAGSLQTWTRRVPLQSPAPYTCATANPRSIACRYYGACGG